MGLRITTNVSALNSHTALSRNNVQLARSLERLSSGLRVTRAADDAPGLSISETLRTQVRGGQRAAKNIQDAISCLNVADAGATEMAAILQRMRQLAVQSSNGTYTNADRTSDQAEFTELGNQINNIATYTSFNGINVFLGAGGATVNSGPRSTSNTSPLDTANVSTQTGALVAGLPLVAGNRVLTLGSPADVYGLGAGNPSIVVTASGPGPATNIPFGAGGFTYNAGTQQVSINNGALAGFSNVTVTYVNQGALTNIPLTATPIAGSQAVTANGVPVPPGGANGFTTAGNTLTLNGTARPTATFPLTIGAGYTATGTTTMILNTANPFTGNGASSLNNLTFNVNGAPVAFSQPADYTLAPAQVAQVGNTPLFAYTVTFNNASIAAAASGQTTITANYDIDYPTITGPYLLTVQKGANNGETQVISLPPLTLGTLNLGATSLASQGGAMSGITDIDNAIAILNTARSGYGADTNRLQHAFNAVEQGVESQASADSRIRDADMADQTSQLTRQQIMTQGSIEALRTAQQSPAVILKLLGQ
ncbi:MAG: flagellin [Cyanobacteria bacterium RYN_339]|nr:flagellin [Cyanobacteria bacterium RYN_339]